MYIARRVVTILFIILFISSCKKTPTSSEPTGVTFQDANLETLIREVLNKPDGDIDPADLLTITELDGGNRDISDISGIEYCTNLQELGLAENQISEITALTELTNLKYLNLRDNQISEISALSSLTNLELLIVSFNQIIDISALSSLTNLHELYIYENQIIDIYPLIQNSGFNNGDEVMLYGNPLNDASINTYIPQLEARGVTVYS